MKTLLLIVTILVLFACTILPCMLSSRISQEEEMAELERMIENRELPEKINVDYRG